MQLPSDVAAPEIFTSGAEEMISTAQRLGLTWQLKLATVASMVGVPMVAFDGDSAATGGSTPTVQVVSMFGPLTPDSRVWVMVLPNGLNVVVGFATDGPTRRIATSVESTDSATFDSTETEIGTVTAPCVAGNVYRITFATQIGTSVANDRANLRIRQDSLTGVEMAIDAGLSLPNAGTAGNYQSIEAEYYCTDSRWTTFVGTCNRASGTGVLRREAATNRRQYLYVDYVRTYIPAA